MVIFHGYVNIYQRVTNGIEYSPAISGFLRHVRFPGPSVSPSAPCESGIASGWFHPTPTPRWPPHQIPRAGPPTLRRWCNTCLGGWSWPRKSSRMQMHFSECLVILAFFGPVWSSASWGQYIDTFQGSQKLGRSSHPAAGSTWENWPRGLANPGQKHQPTLTH